MQAVTEREDRGVSGQGKVAFVTGASFGIGAATAVALARRGYEIALSATRRENLAQTRAAIDKAGGRALPVQLDLQNLESIDAAVSEVLRHFGRLDVLVNNAGTTLRKPAVEIAHDEWAAVMNTNLTGTFFITQKLARHLQASGRPGTVINVASTHGIVAASERAAYGISKAAMIHMTKMLALEWAPYAIRVNAVAPGRVETGSPARVATASDQSRLQSLRSRIPLGRFCASEEVAEAICYLVGPQAGFITGHVLVLDGGLTLY